MSADEYLHRPDSVHAEGGTASSRHAHRDADPAELVALVELLREGDRVLVNERVTRIEVERVSDTADRRDVLLIGNGTHYDIELDRRDPDVVLRVGTTHEEPLERLRVTNRNPLHVREYERLLPEEIETTAPKHYFDSIKHRPRDSLQIERTYDAVETEIVRWATSRYLDATARAHFSSGTDYTRNLWDDARTLWHRMHNLEEFTAYGDEMGKIGAFLDYAVEDSAISLPDAVAEQVDLLRVGEDPTAAVSDAPHPTTVPQLHE